MRRSPDLGSCTYQNDRSYISRWKGSAYCRGARVGCYRRGWIEGWSRAPWYGIYWLSCGGSRGIHWRFEICNRLRSHQYRALVDCMTEGATIHTNNSLGLVQGCRREGDRLLCNVGLIWWLVRKGLLQLGPVVEWLTWRVGCDKPRRSLTRYR